MNSPRVTRWPYLSVDPPPTSTTSRDADEEGVEGESIKLVLLYPEWTYILFRYLAYGDRADEARFDATFLARARALGKEVPEGLE